MSIHTSSVGNSSSVGAVSFSISTVFTGEDNFEALHRLLHVTTVMNKMVIKTAKLTANATNIIVELVASIELEFNRI